MKIQNYGLQVNEAKNKGLKEVPIEWYSQLLDNYIESLHTLENSRENFNKLLDIYGSKQ
jgi:hypothetical protein